MTQMERELMNSEQYNEAQGLLIDMMRRRDIPPEERDVLGREVVRLVLAAMAEDWSHANPGWRKDNAVWVRDEKRILGPGAED